MWAKIPAALAALAMGANGLIWQFNPAQAAQSLGMPLLEGVGRSTQIGDFGAFFIGIAVFCVLGLLQRNVTWLYSAAILLALTATLRTGAWLFHGAAFAQAMIIAEVILVALILTSAYLLSRQSQT
jgi:hypothetical protein